MLPTPDLRTQSSTVCNATSEKLIPAFVSVNYLLSILILSGKTGFFVLYVGERFLMDPLNWFGRAVIISAQLTLKRETTEDEI